MLSSVEALFPSAEAEDFSFSDALPGLFMIDVYQRCPLKASVTGMYAYLSCLVGLFPLSNLLLFLLLF